MGPRGAALGGCAVGRYEQIGMAPTAGPRASGREDGGAAFAQPLCHRLADPLGTAGHQRLAAGELASVGHQRISSDEILSPTISKTWSRLTGLFGKLPATFADTTVLPSRFALLLCSVARSDGDLSSFI